MSLDTMHTDHLDTPTDLPTSKEIYGSLTVLLTYLVFALFLVWSLSPTAWLEAIGWSWYPSQ